jgi:hypothetical protein
LRPTADRQAAQPEYGNCHLPFGTLQDGFLFKKLHFFTHKKDAEAPLS